MSRFVDRGAITAAYVGIGMAITIAVSFILIIPIEPIIWLLTIPAGLLIGYYANQRSDRRAGPWGRIVLNAAFAGLVTGLTLAAFLLLPRAVDRTTVVCTLLFAADEVAGAEFDPADARDLWDLVNRQDWAICESVQRGMSSRAYTHGWFAPMEDDSADIRRWLLPRLGHDA